METGDGAAEWRKMWILPVIAMFGVAGNGLYGFSSGVFMDELIRTFGWSRSEFSSAMSGYVIIGFLCLPLVGRAIDRFGPRAVALAGLAPAVCGTAMLGLANGNIWQWRILVGIQSAGLVMIAPPVWITAVVSRFRASRGLAIAVALAGVGVGTGLWPVLAAFFIEKLGWRLAYPALALSWGLVVAPLTLLCFARDEPAEVRERPKSSRFPARTVLWSRTFVCLTASGGLFICATYGLMLHLVPVLRWGGHSLAAAAMIAGIAGTFSIIGRIVTGFLLDALSYRLFGLVVFLLPIGTVLLLLQRGHAMPSAIGAAVILGLAMGAETDIVTYIASRRFDHTIFGSIYSIIQSVFAVTSVGGSILAGVLFDMSGSYTPVLWAVIPMSLLGALLFSLVPSPQRGALQPQVPHEISRFQVGR